MQKWTKLKLLDHQNEVVKKMKLPVVLFLSKESFGKTKNVLAVSFTNHFSVAHSPCITSVSQ
jgi:hypothetical protein